MGKRKNIKSKIINLFIRQATIFPIFLLLVVFVSIPIYATTYYVDASNGNNSYPGTEAEPWLTIQHATDILVAGDTVYIKQGIYEEIVDLTGSTGIEGESGNEVDGYITYMGYPGHNAILDGTTFQVQGWGVGFCSGRYTPSGGDRTLNYIKINNLTIRNYPEAGIEFNRDSNGKGSHHIILDELTVHNNGDVGIYIWEGWESEGTTHDIIVRNCESYSNDNHGIKFNGDDAGVINRGHIHNSIIENCISHDNLYIGIHISTGNYNITVRNNTCYNNGRQGIAAHEIWDSEYKNNTVYENGQSGGDEREGMVIWNSKNVTVRCNRIYCNPGYGLRLYGDLVNTGSSPTIVNNVIFNNGEGGIGISTDINNGEIYHNTIASNQGTGLYINNSVSGHDIKNNIVYQNSVQLLPGNGNTFDYNLYYPEISFIGMGAHNIFGDPLFVDPSDPIYDFHLQSTSPAIDSGTDVGVNSDIEGTLRPQGAGYDIGAYEYFTTSTDEQFNGKQLMFRLYQNYPNPFNELTVISYSLKVSGKVSLGIYNMRGQEVWSLINENQPAGEHSVIWNGTNNSGEPIGSGIYFCKFNINNIPVSTKKMILL